MKLSVFTRTAVIPALLVLIAVTVSSRAVFEPGQTGRADSRLSADSPLYCLVAHRVGEIGLAVTNNGTFGKEFIASTTDWFTGESIPLNCEYRRGSGVEYLFAGAFWIGAVVGRDTLVSTGFDGWQVIKEMSADEAPFGEMIYRSTLDPSSPNYSGAVSEEDYIAVYTDTHTDDVPADPVTGRPHKPLNIEVTEVSYAWSYPYAEDFVLFDCKIKNIGSERLEGVYMGVYVDADVGFDVQNTHGFADDICGFISAWPSNYWGCEFTDIVDMAWIADNDGDLGVYFPDGQQHPCPNLTATRIVRTPSYSLDISFNWWISNRNAVLDFGPRERPGMGLWPEPFRDFGTGGLGTPEGDHNKYYVLRNREIDYDQAYTAVIQPNNTLWMYPDQRLAADFCNGFDTKYLLSFGPFDIRPGQSLPISFAYVGGENLHRNPSNAGYLPHDPARYYAGLDFSDIVLNASWAGWIYDNPGVDTDGDGYAGKFRICGDDTFYYEGDGVPDFRAAVSPPGPPFWLEQRSGGLWVRWNGLRSETAKDIFSRTEDFEGYRVYLSQTGQQSSFALVGSYDIEDYVKYYFNHFIPGWETRGVPFTGEELRCLYGDSCGDLSFDPSQYTSNHPFVHPLSPDSMFYFDPVGDNQYIFGVTTPIQKIYPGQPYPSSLDPSQAWPDELTPDGYLKYFEYELLIENISETGCSYVDVRAFDFGWSATGVPPQEGSQGVQMLCPFVCGDVDGSGQEPDVADLVYLISYMFVGGPEPPEFMAADVNGDGRIDISDLIVLVYYIFRSGPAPTC
ncbi:MAG: dockerin type I repeat-containing protein [candidate division Zixibacteria bacterium]|nr:dockerin type I repeat-containing protein [candidate division Zixibacteria bacterium]